MFTDDKPLDPAKASITIEAHLDHRFDHHAPANESIVMAHRRIRTAMRHSASIVQILVPQGREHALALTKLEEAMMWANAGIARAGAVPVRQAQDGTLVADDGN